MALTPGTRFGPYEVTAQIGVGGMGEVYKATDTNLKRAVAIKVLPASVAADAERLARFQREAEVLAALNHPNIAAIYGLERSGGMTALVMELVEGPTLADRIAQGAIPLDEALPITKQIAEALEAAHEQGIMHRDLKPANIKVRPDGTVKLLDFGLAKAMEPTGAMAMSASMSPTITTPAMTQAGMILGTAAYMSPEQARGKVVDKRADIWAFGAVLFEMLTGKRAFEGETVADTLSAVLRHEPDWKCVPAKARRLLQQCLEKEPKRRLRDIGDAKLLLEDYPQAERVRHPKAPWAIAAIAVVTALGLAFLDFRRAPVEQTVARVSVLPPENTTFTSDAAPVISPDGRKLAFVARDSSGRALLWVRSLDSLTAQPLTGTEDARQPFWSPDSRFVGFFSRGRLQKIDMGGGPPQTVADTSSTLTYSATWGAEGVILIGGTGVTPLQSVPAVGGQLKPATILNSSREERSHGFPYFLPDGHHFIYSAVSARSENSGIYVGSTDSKGTKRLLNIRSQVIYAPPGYLLFVREGTLMAQVFDTSRLELSGDPFPIGEQIVSDPVFGNGMFSVSGNGVLAYRAGGGSGNTQLTWFDRSGKRLGTVAPPGEYVNTDLSPDGQRLLFERRSPQGDRDVWLLELSRGVTTRLTFNPSDDQQPTWSRDGSRIVFGSNRDRSYGLYQKPSSGAGNEELLLRAATDVAPMTWSPDERSLLYRSVNKNGFNEVWVLPMTGERKPFPFLQSENFSQSSPRLSPDGRWLAYYSLEAGSLEVYIQSYPKPTGKWQVSTTGGIQPQWSRNGNELFYLGADRKLMAVSVRGDSAAPELGTPQPLFEAPVLGGFRVIFGFRQQYNIAPDGQRFLVNVPVAEEAGAPITVVLNWLAGLKR